MLPKKYSVEKEDKLLLLSKTKGNISGNIQFRGFLIFIYFFRAGNLHNKLCIIRIRNTSVLLKELILRVAGGAKLHANL